MSWTDTLGGVTLSLCLGASLVLGFRAAERKQELNVHLPRAQAQGTTATHPLGAHGITDNSLSPDPAVQLGPPEVLNRLLNDGAPDFLGPGIAMRTWRLVYGQRWEREVTLPILRGPFDRMGEAWPCSIAVRMRPNFFDDNRPGGADVESVIERKVAGIFPRTLRNISFPDERHVEVHITPSDGLLVAQFVLELVDTTRFSGRIEVRLSEQDGQIVAQHRLTQFLWTGPTRQQQRLVMFLDMVSDVVDAAVRRVVDEQVGRHVNDVLTRSIARLRRPFRLFPQQRPNDRYQFRLCGPPVIRPDGLTLMMGLTANIAEPLTDPTVVGPTHFEMQPVVDEASITRESQADPNAANIDIFASGAAVHQALFILWQTGQLQTWGNRPSVVQGLREKINNRLNFEVTGLGLRLPPVILPESSLSNAWHIRLADVALGREGSGRTVIAHGSIRATASDRDGVIFINGMFRDARINCVDRGSAEDWVFSPCFSDVVAALRPTGELDRPFTFGVDEGIFDHLLRWPLGGRLAIHFEGLRVTSEGTPAQVHLRATARFLDEQP